MYHFCQIIPSASYRAASGSDKIAFSASGFSASRAIRYTVVRDIPVIREI